MAVNEKTANSLDENLTRRQSNENSKTNDTWSGQTETTWALEGKHPLTYGTLQGPKHFRSSGPSHKHPHGLQKRTFLERNAFFVTFLLSSMIDSLVTDVREQFRYRFFHSKYERDFHKYNVTEECGVELQPEVQAIENAISRETAQWALYKDYVTIVPHILALLLMGLKSDQMGRRFAFLYPFFTAFVDFLLLAVIIWLQVHFGYTLIGDFVRSISGGATAMHVAAYAIISDTHGKEQDVSKAGATSSNAYDKHEKILDADRKTADKQGTGDDDPDNDLDMSREKHRTFKIVLLHVAHDLAKSLVSLTTGYVIQYAGFFYTTAISLALKVLLFIFAFAFITETGQQKKSPGFIEPLKVILRTTKNPRNRRTLLLVNMAVVFYVMSFVVERDVMKIYQMSPPFCLDAVQLGYVSSESSLKGVFAIPVLWLWRRLHLMESTIAAVGVCSTVASTLMLATIRQIWVFFVASSFALMIAVDEIFSFGGGQAGNYLYSGFVDSVPTAPFYLASGTFALSAMLYTAETCLQRRYAKTDG